MKQNRFFELSTFLGISVAAILILAAIISGGNVYGFIDISAIMIVLFGTFFLTAACFSFREVIRANKTIFKAMFKHSEDPGDIGHLVLKIADIARKKNIFDLEHHTDLIHHAPLFKKAVEMLIDNVEHTKIQSILRHDIEATVNRHQNTVQILRKAAEIAPAMGLIGTLVGLIQMLGNLSNPDSIGPAMAVALLTTMYGAILAYVIFIPLASKLERNTQNELLAADIYIQATESIAKQENPRELERLLNSILPTGRKIRYFN